MHSGQNKTKNKARRRIKQNKKGEESGRKRRMISQHYKYGKMHKRSMHNGKEEESSQTTS